jgi:hypothetical protein
MTNHNKPTELPKSFIDEAITDAEVYDIGAGTKRSVMTELDDGTAVRIFFSQKLDEDTRLNDYECYGETSKYAYSYLRGESRTPRPDHFTGAARKIEVDRGYWMWWQPPADYNQLDAEVQRRLYNLVVDLLRGGFTILFVEVEYRCSCCGTWADLASFSLGGIEVVNDDIKGEVLYDALGEANITVTPDLSQEEPS